MNGSGESGEAQGLLTSFPAEPMVIWPISTRVNSPKNDDAGVIIPLVIAEVENHDPVGAAGGRKLAGVER